MNTFERKIGSNRGKSRLWIEGKQLTLAGFKHGMRWDLVPCDSGAFYITQNDDGARKIAGKPDRPIVDITGAVLDSVRATGLVSISYEPGIPCLKVEMK